MTTQLGKLCRFHTASYSSVPIAYEEESTLIAIAIAIVIVIVIVIAMVTSN